MSYASFSDILEFGPAPPEIVGAVETSQPDPLYVGDDVQALMPSLEQSSIATRLFVAFYHDLGGSYARQGEVIEIALDGNEEAGDVIATYRATSGDEGKIIAAGIRTTFDGAISFSAGTTTVLAQAPEPGLPEITASDVTFEGTSEGNDGIKLDPNNSGVYVQTADATLLSGITMPAGHTLKVLRQTGTAAPLVQFAADWDAVADVPYDGNANSLWRTNSGGSHDQVQRLYLWWENDTSGVLETALESPGYLEFTSNVPEEYRNTGGSSEPIPSVPIGNLPDADETLGTASSNAVANAVQSRANSGSSGTWIIDIPSGNYGQLDLRDVSSNGKIIVRSENRNLGAVFSRILLQRAVNIEFQCVMVDRTGQGYAQSAVDMAGSDRCGFLYGEADFGTPTPNSDDPRGWNRNVFWGFNCWRDDVDNRQSSNVTIYMNYIHGPADTGIYLGGGSDQRIESNVFAEIGGDDIQMGAGERRQFINNWGSRTKFPYYNPNSNDWKHTDFIQGYTPPGGTKAMEDHEFIGNVMLKGEWDPSIGIPTQGLFTSKSRSRRWTFKNNIIATNTPNALYVQTNDVPSAFAEDHYTGNNTVLRSIDDFKFSNGGLHTAQVTVWASNSTRTRNVQCGFSGSQSMGSDGLNIPMDGNPVDYTASRDYYVNPVLAATFYEYRPIEGQPTHWDYSSGPRQGAWEKFRDVIQNGPGLQGPALAAWKQWYDWKDQILPA